MQLRVTRLLTLYHIHGANAGTALSSLMTTGEEALVRIGSLLCTRECVCLCFKHLHGARSGEMDMLSLGSEVFCSKTVTHPKL